MENVTTENKIKKIKLDFKDSKYATGRRKRSVARVWVKKGSGNIHVNGMKMNEYFKRPVHQIIVTRPLKYQKLQIIMTLNVRSRAAVFLATGWCYNFGYIKSFDFS